jgi:hypothetical protein
MNRKFNINFNLKFNLNARQERVEMQKFKYAHQTKQNNKYIDICSGCVTPTQRDRPFTLLYNL